MLTGLGTRTRFSASTVDQMPRHVASGHVFGSPVAIPVPDLDRTDHLVILGANPYASNGSVCTAPDFPGRIEAIQARGGKVVVVDPRLSRTAEQADQWISIRPGTDAGLLAAMRDVSPETVQKDKTPFGPILETFVFSELRKIASWSEQRCSFSHYRDKDKNEVDIVLENRRGEIVGIEVKSSATVSGDDFSGMRKLAEACGKKFVQGLVLYDHDQVVPFADNMFAAPLSCLWGAL